MTTLAGVLMFAVFVLAYWMLDSARAELGRRCIELEARIAVLEAHDRKTHPRLATDAIFIEGRLQHAENLRAMLQKRPSRKVDPNDPDEGDPDAMVFKPVKS